MLAVQPVFAALVPLLAFGSTVPAVLAGAVAWGAAMGLQESIMRAAVADLVPAHRRGTAYGVFGAVYGLAWFGGAAGVGVLYGVSVRGTVAAVAVVQLVALVVLLVAVPRTRP